NFLFYFGRLFSFLFNATRLSFDISVRISAETVQHHPVANNVSRHFFMLLAVGASRIRNL
ncbi:hypothetical protein L9F63_010668, partial [Diploptera punctata]